VLHLVSMCGSQTPRISSVESTANRRLSFAIALAHGQALFPSALPKSKKNCTAAAAATRLSLRFTNLLAKSVSIQRCFLYFCAAQRRHWWRAHWLCRQHPERGPRPRNRTCGQPSFDLHPHRAAIQVDASGIPRRLDAAPHGVRLGVETGRSILHGEILLAGCAEHESARAVAEDAYCAILCSGGRQHVV
jgi:hypothetical protein